MNTSLLPRLLTISENFWLPKFQPPTDKSVLRVGFVFFRLLKRLYISLSFQSNGMIWIDKKRRENWKKEYQIKQVKNQVNWLCLLQGLRSNCFRPFHYLLTNQTQKFPWNIDQEIVVEKWKKANFELQQTQCAKWYKWMGMKQKYCVGANLKNKFRRTLYCSISRVQSWVFKLKA